MLVLWVSVLTGQPTLKQQLFQTLAECEAASTKLMEQVDSDSNLVLITAGCFGKVAAQGVS